jgi:hypothetical protein
VTPSSSKPNPLAETMDINASNCNELAYNQVDISNNKNNA